ncbi:MAG TPA: SDR family NAD(P)-dependent oxidoreductase [Anaerolineales bacterium]|nr:SDR family NAD(P)-dependent oxidoreductase [Anaerolineales bacterium]
MPALTVDTPLSSRPRAVIVGASSGIGAELARQLARDGYALALLARRADELKSLTDQINADAGEACAVSYPHDVTDYAAVPGMFQQLLKDLQRIDAFIYVAGVMPNVAFSEYSFEKDKLMTEVHLLGAMAWLGQVATLFERVKTGQIVGISSVAADRGRVKNPAYNASKAGFDTYLEALRNRLTRSGVHVLTVRPGPVDTPMTKEVGGLFMVPPAKVVQDIRRAMRRRQQVLYTPARWRLIMFVVRNLPSVIFRRLNF